MGCHSCILMNSYQPNEIDRNGPIEIEQTSDTRLSCVMASMCWVYFPCQSYREKIDVWNSESTGQIDLILSPILIVSISDHFICWERGLNSSLTSSSITWGKTAIIYILIGSFGPLLLDDVRDELRGRSQQIKRSLIDMIKIGERIRSIGSVLSEIQTSIFSHTFYRESIPYT